MASFEGADYLLDLEETSASSRKRLWSVAFDNAGYGRADPSYVSFFKSFYEYWDAKVGVEEEEEEEEEEEDEEEEEEEEPGGGDDDPAYKGFLSKLKVHGNAYMCDLSEEDGVYHPIIYEEEDNSIDMVKRRTARMRTRARDGEKRFLHQGDDMKSARKSSAAKNVSCDELKRRSFDGGDDRKSRLKKSDLGNDHPDGIMERRGTPVASKVDYVTENRRLEVDADQRAGPADSNFGKKIYETDKDFDFFLKHLHFEGEHAYLEYEGQKRVYYEDINQQNTDVVVEPLETDTRPPASIMRPSTPVPRPPTLIMRPSTPVPRPPTSPSRALITKSEKRTPRDAHNMLTTSNKKHKNEDEVSLYWRQLHDDLRRPYSQKEFDNLYAYLSERKPVSIYKESRRGGYYNPGHLGKSYLDLYPDLNREIEKVKSDSHKVLNLFRMFMIYLQKIPALCGSDQIKPWMSDFCKTILPGSSDEPMTPL